MSALHPTMPGAMTGGGIEAGGIPREKHRLLGFEGKHKLQAKGAKLGPTHQPWVVDAARR